MLTVMCCTELLVEKWGRRHQGDDTTRRLIILIEAVKLVLRLIILSKEEGGMLLNGGRYLLSAAADPDPPLLGGDLDENKGLPPSDQATEGPPYKINSRRPLWEEPSPYVETRGRRKGRRFLTCRPAGNDETEAGVADPAVSVMDKEDEGMATEEAVKEDGEAEDREKDGDEPIPEADGGVEEQKTGEAGKRAREGVEEKGDGPVATPASEPVPPLSPLPPATEREEGSAVLAAPNGGAPSPPRPVSTEVSESSGEAGQVDPHIRKLKQLRMAGEVLRLIRPLLQAAWGGASGASSAGGSKWSPLIVSLLLDLLSLSCSAESMEGDASVERRKELERRRLLLLLYFLRPPVYQSTTEPMLERVLGAASKLPLMGWVSSLGLTSARYVQRYHFYTSGSG